MASRAQRNRPRLRRDILGWFELGAASFEFETSTGIRVLVFIRGGVSLRQVVEDLISRWDGK